LTFRPLSEAFVRRSWYSVLPILDTTAKWRVTKAVGETGRKFGVRLQEFRTEVESKTRRTFTRSHRVSSLTEHNKSALTDHATQENHVINWSQATVIDREPECFTRWIKVAVHILKEGQQAMNRDEGSYQYAYDLFLDTASSRRVKNRKN